MGHLEWPKTDDPVLVFNEIIISLVIIHTYVEQEAPWLNCGNYFMYPENCSESIKHNYFFLDLRPKDINWIYSTALEQSTLQRSWSAIDSVFWQGFVVFGFAKQNNSEDANYFYYFNTVIALQCPRTAASFTKQF